MHGKTSLKINGLAGPLKEAVIVINYLYLPLRIFILVILYHEYDA